MRSLDAEPISQVLAAPRVDEPLNLERSRWGFGGVHGGLALVTERLDAWAPDGAHLGSGEQLRVVTRR